MLSDVVLAVDEKMLLFGRFRKDASLNAIGNMSSERCFQKDAIRKMLRWALPERCSRKDAPLAAVCRRKKCFFRRFRKDTSLDAAKKMLPAKRCRKDATP